MSRGDHNLDRLYKEAFKPQEHEIVPEILERSTRNDSCE